MGKVLIVFPTAWDRRQLSSCAAAIRDRYTLLYGEPDDESCPWDFDVPAYIERAAEEHRGDIEGVMSSSDYPGATVAAAVAAKLGLPGASPEAVIRCSHKYYSRIAQQEADPAATARFWLVDPEKVADAAGEIAFPCYIKPVKGAFSVMAKRLDGPRELLEFMARPAVAEFLHDYVHIFNRLVEHLTDFEVGGSYFLAEQLLHGSQVTVEGFAQDGAVELLGIVDSVMYPGTSSFARFDYPSRLPAGVQRRMEEVARRVIGHIGLDRTLFNMEMIYDASTEALHILEINPRLCGQFADLYEKVDGVNGYEVALALATGERPRLRRGAGAFRCASSFPLRVFEPVRATRVPDEEEIRAVEARHPGALIWLECDQGQVLSDFVSIEDGQSCRYAIVNLGADDLDDAEARLANIRADLDLRLEPLEGVGARS